MYALIDNATLTAVQRIMGQIPTRSLDSVDVDLLALENLVQAILLYDDIIAIDDYKPEHKGNRHEIFNYIRFLDPKEFSLGEIEDKAYKDAEKLLPQIHGGEFVNEEFKTFFELLKTNIICTWDLNSSEFHLTLKVLAEQNSEEFHKYGKLAAAIFSELIDAKKTGDLPQNEISLVDSYGNPIQIGYTIDAGKHGRQTKGMTHALRSFIASLVWIANRTIFYSLSARHLHADVFLYPIRQSYQQYYIGRTSRHELNYTKSLIESFSTQLSDSSTLIRNGIVGTKLPIFSAWLVREAGDVKNVLKTAYEIRYNKHLHEMREQIREMNNLFNETSDISEPNKKRLKLSSDIEKASKEVLIKYGVDSGQKPIRTALIFVFNLISKLPEFMNNISDLFDLYRKRKGMSALYRDITRDLSTIASLGELRSKLGAEVIKEENVPVYNPKNEEPEFRNKHSYWKSPM